MYKKGYSKLKMSSKLSLFAIGTNVIPLLILGVVLLSVQRKIAFSQAEKAAVLATTHLADIIGNKLTRINAAANLFYTDLELQQLLLTIDESADGEALPREDTVLFGKYDSAADSIFFRTAIITNKNEIIGNLPFKQKYDGLNIHDFEWYKKIDNVQQRAIWIMEPKLDKLFTSFADHYVYIIRQLHDFGTWKPVGTLIIAVSEFEFRKMYSNYVEDYQSTYIIDEKGQVVAYTDNLNFGDRTIDPFTNFENFSGSFLSNPEKNQTFLTTFHTINRTNWKIITYCDLETILSPYSKTMYTYIGVLLLLSVVFLFFSIFFAREFLKPVKELHLGMIKVKEGDINTRISVTSNDEVAELSEQFNEMLDTIAKLMTNVVSEQKLKREAEILALQTQINPHFLYNTLASIRYQILTDDKKSADETILALIRLMKNILSDTKEFITIRTEMALLRDYIDIQKKTMSNDLVTNINCDKEIEDCLIIRLLLQPIVENAIMHGLKPKRGGCELTVSASEFENRIRIDITDNGVGFDAHEHSFLTDNSFAHKRIGMNNVISRIQTTYGSSYGIIVSSRKGIGTHVQITIPKVKEEYTEHEYINS